MAKSPVPQSQFASMQSLNTDQDSKKGPKKKKSSKINHLGATETPYGLVKDGKAVSKSKNARHLFLPQLAKMPAERPASIEDVTPKASQPIVLKDYS